MSNFDEFWQRIINLTPGFGNSDSTKVTMTVGSVRKLAERAHRDGFHSGLETAKSLENIIESSNPFKDILDFIKKKTP